MGDRWRSLTIRHEVTTVAVRLDSSTERNGDRKMDDSQDPTELSGTPKGKTHQTI